jgi:hypothetical protein
MSNDCVWYGQNIVDLAAARDHKRLTVMTGLFRRDFTSVSKDCLLCCEYIVYFECLISNGEDMAAAIFIIIPTSNSLSTSL